MFKLFNKCFYPFCQFKKFFAREANKQGKPQNFNLTPRVSVAIRNINAFESTQSSIHFTSLYLNIHPKGGTGS
jgi:hypothetical protein